jgi:hypothetical protein
MLAVIWAALAVNAATASLSAEGTTPAGTFACGLLSAESYDGSPDSLIPSVFGEVTLDGIGGYAQATGGGMVAWKRNGLHFTSGEMSGTVAQMRQDAKGRRFLHIDSTVMNEPAGDPKFGDHICVEE